jgi:CubicO group peptidase (beta-lactamase class C family)
MRLLILLLLVTLFLIFGGCVQSNESYSNRFPDEEWDYESDPEAQGWDLTKLAELKTFIQDSCYTTGMMVIHNGKVVFEHGKIHDVSYKASCRKSVLALLYGPFVENGRVDLNSTLEDLQLDDVGGLLPIEKKATVANLLTSRSGVYHPASNPGDQHLLAPMRGSVEPGTVWLYNNWDFNAAGFILERLTHKSVYDLVDSMLARPLKMRDWNRSIQEKSGNGSSLYPAYHMWFSTDDMARIGYLVLREGNWKGEQIISKEWIKKIVTPVTSYEEAFANKRNMAYFGYGYMWWSWDSPDNAWPYNAWYTAMGAFGQYITVLPEIDLVVVHKNNSITTDTQVDTYLKILRKVTSAKNFENDGFNE